MRPSGRYWWCGRGPCSVRPPGEEGLEPSIENERLRARFVDDDPGVDSLEIVRDIEPRVIRRSRRVRAGGVLNSGRALDLGDAVLACGRRDAGLLEFVVAVAARERDRKRAIFLMSSRWGTRVVDSRVAVVNRLRTLAVTRPTAVLRFYARPSCLPIGNRRGVKRTKGMALPSLGGCVARQMTTTIPLSEDTRDRLKAKKTGGESYDSLLNRLMNEADAGTGDS